MYKTILVVLAITLSGCSSAAEDLRPFVAVSGRYALMTDKKPGPAIQTDCSNCRGTGVVGDSRVTSKCPVCNGTGKVTSSSAQCKDGTCPKPTSR